MSFRVGLGHDTHRLIAGRPLILGGVRIEHDLGLAVGGDVPEQQLFPAAALVAQLGAKAEVARELAYRLYTLCERKKRAAEALAYNGLVQSWPELTRLAREGGKAKTAKQSEMFGEGEES